MCFKKEPTEKELFDCLIGQNVDVLVKGNSEGKYIPGVVINIKLYDDLTLRFDSKDFELKFGTPQEGIINIKNHATQKIIYQNTYLEEVYCDLGSLEQIQAAVRKGEFWIKNSE